MKSVMLSMHTYYVYQIASKAKKYEFRKDKPKCELPFKCYIYETLNSGGNGKVVGEFVCDRIGELLAGDKTFEGVMLSTFELRYLDGKNGYGWHISQLKMYNNPIKLSEFAKVGSRRCCLWSASASTSRISSMRKTERRLSRTRKV